LKELSMPDLDQIKQEEQERGTGAGGFPRAGRAIAGRPAAAAIRAAVSYLAAWYGHLQHSALALLFPIGCLPIGYFSTYRVTRTSCAISDRQ
jgi:hypothetical protein